jgi:hypothetical protein
MSFVRQFNPRYSDQVGKDSVRKGSYGRVGVITFVPPRVGYPNPMPQEKPAPISSLERKK